MAQPIVASTTAAQLGAQPLGAPQLGAVAAPSRLAGIKKIGKSLFNGIKILFAYRLIFLVLFLALFYRIIYNICVFFGIDIIILDMYMGWVSFILVLFTFLPFEYSEIFPEP